MVTLQEVVELQGKRHALFPWVPGVTLRDVVKALEADGTPAPIGLMGRVLVDTARALAAITPGRAHGGIQDGAIQIGFDGKVSVLDFGAPRASRFRPIGRVNFAADVFALGGVLHTVLTGFAGDYASPQVAHALPSTSHAEATPAIDDVVTRALSPQPDSRQADAATFADELEAVLGEALSSAEQLAEVVSALFEDRIKLLHSLGGLITEQPSLEAVLPSPSAPMAPIPMGTQPGVGGPRPEPPSEPTLPRISLGDEPSERTDVRMSLPEASRSLVPWDSGDELSSATEVAQVPVSGPRPSSPVVRLSSAAPDTNPSAARPVREAEADTNPRAAAPSLPSDTDESSAPRPRVSAPRPSGIESEHAVTRASGPRALSRSDVEPARPRASSSRPALADTDSAKTAATSLPEDTNPRAMRPARLENDVAATGPRPGPQPGLRNTTEAERYRAKGQERLPTPPAGSPAVPVDDDDDILNEPTAVRSRPDARMTAQTAQTLTPAPAPSSGAGLRVVMVVLLVLVIGIAVAVVLKLKRQSEEPLPFDESALDESVLEADAGLQEPLDAGEELVGLIADLDGGEDEEEEEEEFDGGELHAGDVDAGSTEVDAGVADAGEVKVAPVKKPIKKVVKKKKRRR